MMELNMEITTTEEKLVGKSMIPENPPAVIKIENPRLESLNMSM